MPQAVAELIETTRIVASTHASLLVEVGDVGHLRPQSALYVGAAAARNFQFAELAGEIHLPFVVEILAAKYQDGIAVDRLPQRRDGGFVERPYDIDAADLADEERVQLAYGK